MAQDLPTYANFIVAGASGMSAWVFIHPADLVKTRMQLLGDEKKGATAVSVGKDLVIVVGRRMRLATRRTEPENLRPFFLCCDFEISLQIAKYCRTGRV